MGLLFCQTAYDDPNPLRHAGEGVQGRWIVERGFRPLWIGEVMNDGSITTKDGQDAFLLELVTADAKTVIRAVQRNSFSDRGERSLWWFSDTAQDSVLLFKLTFGGV